MAFYTNLENVHLNRPIKPIYGWVQATPQSWELAEGETCFPGMAMTNIGGGKVRGAKAGEKIVGICSTFANEIEGTAPRQVAVWVLTEAAVMEIETRVTDITEVSTAQGSLEAGKTVYVGLGTDSKLAIVEDEENAAYRVVDVIGTTAIQIAGL